VPAVGAAAAGVDPNWNPAEAPGAGAGVCWLDAPKTNVDSALGVGIGVVLGRPPKDGTPGVALVMPPNEGAAGVAATGACAFPKVGIMLEVVPPVNDVAVATVPIVAVLLPKDGTVGALVIGALLDDAPKTNGVGVGALFAVVFAFVSKVEVEALPVSAEAAVAEPNLKGGGALETEGLEIAAELCCALANEVVPVMLG
jgi:hypothetical protein